MPAPPVLDEGGSSLLDEAGSALLDEGTAPVTGGGLFTLSADGTLSGAAPAGVYAINVQVTDALGATATAALFLTIGPANPVVLPGNPGTPSLTFPQLHLEAGMVTAQPVVPPGTFILGDPVNGKLDTGKLGDSTSWTDITGYMLNATIARTSTREQGPLITYQPGTISATLDNSSVPLTAGNAAGPFDAGNLTGPYMVDGVSAIRAMLPIRARAGYGNTEYALIYTFADSWSDPDVTYDQGYDEVTVAATDGFKVLAGQNIPQIPLAAGAGEPSGTRVIRILNAAMWFTDHRRIGPGDSGVAGTTFGDSPLNLLQLTADSEIGELYIDGGGNLVFRNRHAILTEARSTQVQAIFGDLPGTSHPGGTELAYASVTRANDDTQLANLVQITIASGGTEQDASNAASLRTNLFPRTYTRNDILLESNAEALAYAQWVLAVSLKPEDRFDAITIDALADPANLFPQVLGREIGDRIQIWRRPQSSGATITRDCFIRGITHTIDATAGSWQTQWDLQDATPYSGFLILGDPVNGKLNTAKLAF